MRGRKQAKEGSTFAHLCPALGPGGAGSAQGHHGAAADESGLMWHRLGHRQKVYLCCLFPSGSQAQGKPVGAVAPSWLDVSTRAKFLLSHYAVLQIWASLTSVCQDSMKRQGSCPNGQCFPDVAACCVSSLGYWRVCEHPDRDALPLAPHQLPLWNGLHPRLHSVS